LRCANARGPGIEYAKVATIVTVRKALSSIESFSRKGAKSAKYAKPAGLQEAPLRICVFA
jgi:hypothetical protein